MPLIREAAQKALRIDPSLPLAHALLGAVAAVYDYDWVQAERLFRLATRGDSVPPSVRFTSMFYLLPIGRSQDAVVEYERALDEDPLNLVGRFQYAFCLQVAGMPARGGGVSTCTGPRRALLACGVRFEPDLRPERDAARGAVPR